MCRFDGRSNRIGAIASSENVCRYSEVVMPLVALVQTAALLVVQVQVAERRSAAVSTAAQIAASASAT